jgi:hypothetical protein
MSAVIIKMSIQRMVCTGCGAETNANCNCGVSYVPKAHRAKEAIKTNPEKSDRSIAKELGISQPTVSAARHELGDKYLSPERHGLDDKTYSVRSKKEDTESPSEEITPKEKK